ncbi:MAG: tetraacyldisaccharide 4'-kinase [Oligoflexales bacterium]
MELQKQIYKSQADQNIFFKILAFLPSKIISTLANLRALLFQWKILPIKKLPGKCISIGNISLGGTGKTPLVIEVARFLGENKKKVIILTRGYKSGLKSSEYIVLNNGKVCLGNRKEGQIYADEAMLQSKLLPNAYIVVAAKRFKAAQIFLSDTTINEDDLVFILDDGYQHQQIYRDLNVLLLDAEKPIGNGCILPLGSLRESFHAVERCDMVIWTRTNLVSNLDPWVTIIKQLTENKVSVDADFVEGNVYKVEQGEILRINRDELMNRPLFAVTAIAHPSRFFTSLENVGLIVEEQIVFSDHQRFNMKLLEEKFSYFEGLITTAKDYWREPSLFDGLPISIYFIDLEVNIRSTQFQKTLLSVITH